ncbi:MAG: hypothetical protein IPN62_17110 [Flavobacteriales bacterium]|nr:hypothetical protein [Flavobacteriales bacterium]
MDRNIDRELPCPHQVLTKEHLERPGIVGTKGSSTPDLPGMRSSAGRLFIT